MVRDAMKWVAWALLATLFTGCFILKRSGWNASEYFDDASVVKLCKSIERKDMTDFNRLLDEVDVNVKGQGNMTLLAWALRHANVEAFEALLMKGADPNVKFRAGLEYPFEKTSSVVHVAARAPLEFFRLVLEHGGNPDLPGKRGDSPLITVIKFGGGRKLERVQLLLDSGADVEYESPTGQLALQTAIGWGGQYEIAMKLLEAGADPMRVRKDGWQHAVHVALREKRRAAGWSPQQAAVYDELLRRLERMGCPMDEARADVARWAAWVPLPPSKAKERARQERQLALERQAKRKKLAERKEDQ